jgi:predicted PurR-regulated permease PerM
VLNPGESPRTSGATNSTYRHLITLQAVVLVCAALYFGQPVLMPLVLAILLTFLLRPVVSWIERRGLPRVLAVIAVIIGVFSVLIVTGGLIAGQLNELGANLDSYREQWRTKLAAVRQSRSEAIENVRSFVEELTHREDESANGQSGEARTTPDQRDEFDPFGQPGASQAGTGKAGDNSDEPQPVRVVPEPTRPTDALTAAWGTMSEPLATAAVVVVLTIFMLLGYEDMRGRVLRLAGKGRMTLTTKTLEDAGRRISRYLMAATLVNASFGLAVFLVLSLIGLDYAALWGFLAAVLRFVPYVGPITAAVLPLSLSMLQFEGWFWPSVLAGAFIVLELITNNFVEPLAYGRSAGVSTVALLVSATFWTWIWGPMGLALSIPLTVVLAVLGKHVPQFEALGVLLGDEPPLSPGVTLYQRLLAGDVEEADSLVDEQLAARPLCEVYDDVLLPALAMAERDGQAGLLSATERVTMAETALALIEENAPERNPDSEPRLRLLGCAAQDQMDELALVLLRHVLPEFCELNLLPEALLVAEVVKAAEEQRPDAVLISAVGPGGSAHARHLCKRLRRSQPELRIIVGRWDYRGDRERMTAGLRTRGASQVVVSLAEAIDGIGRIQRLPAVTGG